MVQVATLADLNTANHDDYFTNADGEILTRKDTAGGFYLVKTPVAVVPGAAQTTDLHAEVTLGAGSDPALTINGQELTLTLPPSVSPASAETVTVLPPVGSAEAGVLYVIANDGAYILNAAGDAFVKAADDVPAVTAETDPTYTADKPNIALKSELHDAVTLNAGSDAALTLTGQELNLNLPAAPAETDPVYTADKPNIALKSELHDGAAQDAAIASKADQIALAQEVTDRTAADLLKVDKAEKADNAAYVAGTADKWVDAALLKSAVDGIDLAGDYQGSATTFAGLPASPTNGDWAIKTQDEIGTGDAANPQLPSGIYVTDGTTYSLAKRIPDFAASVIANFVSANADYTTSLLHSPATLDQWRLSNENFTPLADGGTAEVGTGRSVTPGSTINAPTTKPNGQALEKGDYFQIALEADGTVTIAGVAESGTFSGLEASTHAWYYTSTQWIDLDPEIPIDEIPDTTIPPTDPGYGTPGTNSVAGLDAWGQSRRMRRIFNTAGPNFDFTTLNYPDRTAVFIRNVNSASGIGVIHGQATVQGNYANGDTIAGNPASINVQPGEICCMEVDSGVAYVSIFPAERVLAFETYAAANSFGPMPHDSIVAIRGTSEIFARKTGFNNRSFPADGQENADWFKIGGEEIIHHAADAVAVVGKNNISNGFTITLPAVVAGGDFQITNGSTSIYYYANSDATAWVAVAGGDGLRGEPVADNAALTALPARDYERRLVKATNTEYTFKLTADLTAAEDADVANLADDATTGKWVAGNIDGVLAEPITALNFEGPNVQNTSLGTLQPGNYRFVVSALVWQNTSATGMGGTFNIRNAANAVVATLNKDYETSHAINVWQAVPDVVLEFEVTVAQEYTLDIAVLNGNGITLKTVYGTRYSTSEHIDKNSVVPIEDSNVVLIDVDASDNTLYPFSTGETWADLKNNYDYLIFTGNASQSGLPNVRPYSKTFALDVLQLMLDNAGGTIQFDDHYNAVDIWINTPTDTDTGFTYRHTGGDAPANGRMQFRVIGVKKRSTVSGPGVPRTITLTGGLGTIGGQASVTVNENIPAALKLDLNDGQAISSASISNGTISIADPSNGWVTVLAGAADATITITEDTAVTYKGRQLAKVQSYGKVSPFALTGAFQTINLGTDLTNAYIEFDFRPTSETHVATSGINANAINVGIDQGGLIHWYDNSYIRIRVDDNASLVAGNIRLLHINVAFEIVEIRVYKDAENGFVVPTGTVAANRTITLSGGLGTINGGASVTLYEGVPTAVTLDIGTHKAISTISIDNGSVGVSDASSGLVVVTAGSADAVITITLFDTPVSETMGVIYDNKYDPPFALTDSFQDFDLGVNLKDCQIEIDFRADNDFHPKTSYLEANAINVGINAGGYFDWHDAGYIRIRVDDAAAFAMGQIRLLWVNTAFEIISIRVKRRGPYSIVTPIATVSKTQIDLLINSGANMVAPSRLLEGTGAANVIVELPAGQVIDTVAFEAQTLPTGVTAVVKDAQSGAILIEVDDGTGNVDLTVPFKADTEIWNLSSDVQITLGDTATLVDFGTGRVFNALWLIEGKKLFLQAELNWTGSTGGANGSGSYTIDLAQFGGATMDERAMATAVANDGGYTNPRLGIAHWHDPGASAATEAFVMPSGYANKITIGFATSGSSYNNWANDYGAVSTRAQTSFNVMIPIQ